MLTIFTTPKRFKGHSGVIQRNAIKVGQCSNRLPNHHVWER